MSESVEPTIEDNIWQRRSEIIGRLRLSVLYHAKRARFLDMTDKGLLTFTAISATSAAVSLLQSYQNPTVTTWLGVVTAAASILPVVFAPAQAARLHSDLAKSFRQLLAECELKGEYWEMEDCNRFMSRLIEIEIEESAPLGALLADCHNHVAMASGDRSNLIRLSWWHRVFMQVWSFDVKKLQERSTSPT